MSTMTILQTKTPTTNVCPVEPENSRVQKQIMVLIVLSFIFIKKTQIKLWNKTLFISDVVT